MLLNTQKVLLPISVVVILLTPLIIYMHNILLGWALFLFSSLTITLLGGSLIFYIIFDKKERLYILNIIKKRI